MDMARRRRTRRVHGARDRDGDRFWTLDGIERVRELNIFLEHLAIIAGFVLVAILGVVGARTSPEQHERAPPSGGYGEQRFRPKSHGAGHGRAIREALR
jgi:hypothetical protein